MIIAPSVSRAGLEASTRPEAWIRKLSGRPQKVKVLKFKKKYSSATSDISPVSCECMTKTISKGRIVFVATVYRPVPRRSLHHYSTPHTQVKLTKYHFFEMHEVNPPTAADSSNYSRSPFPTISSTPVSPRTVPSMHLCLDTCRGPHS